MGSLSLLQGIFPTRGLKPHLLHFRQILYQLNNKGSPRILEWVKNLPANAGGAGLIHESGRSPNQEDPPEEETATHSSILAWEIPWTEEPGGPWGRKKLDIIEHVIIPFRDRRGRQPFRVFSRLGM